MNFIYILSVNKCQQQIRKNTSEQIKHQTKPEFVYRQIHESCVCLQTNTSVTWLKLLVSKFFMIPIKWERSRVNKSF